MHPVGANRADGLLARTALGVAPDDRGDRRVTARAGRARRRRRRRARRPRRARPRRRRHRAPAAACESSSASAASSAPKMRCPACVDRHRAEQDGRLAWTPEPGQQPGDRAQHRPLRRPHPGTPPVVDQPPVVVGGGLGIAEPSVDRRLRRAGDPGHDRAALVTLGQLDGAGEAGAARGRRRPPGPPRPRRTRRTRRTAWPPRRPRRGASAAASSAAGVVGVAEGEQPRARRHQRAAPDRPTAACARPPVPGRRPRRAAPRNRASLAQTMHTSDGTVAAGPLD